MLAEQIEQGGTGERRKYKGQNRAVWEPLKSHSAGWKSGVWKTVTLNRLSGSRIQAW